MSPGLGAGTWGASMDGSRARAFPWSTPQGIPLVASQVMRYQAPQGSSPREGTMGHTVCQITMAIGRKSYARAAKSGITTSLQDDDVKAMVAAQAIDDAIDAKKTPDPTLVAQDKTPDDLKALGWQVLSLSPKVCRIKGPNGDADHFVYPAEKAVTDIRRHIDDKMAKAQKNGGEDPGADQSVGAIFKK